MLPSGHRGFYSESRKIHQSLRSSRALWEFVLWSPLALKADSLKVLQPDWLEDGRHTVHEEITSHLLSPTAPSDLDNPVITVHQSVGEAKEQFYFERTVFLRCMANSNPPVHYTWKRGRQALTQGSDSGVEIYEPFFTQVSTQSSAPLDHLHSSSPWSHFQVPHLSLSPLFTNNQSN